MIGLLFAPADIVEREQRLGPGEASAKFGKTGPIFDALQRARYKQGLGQTFEIQDNLDKYLNMGEVVCLLKKILKRSMQLVGRLAAAIFAFGDEILSENGSVAIDYDVSERVNLLRHVSGWMSGECSWLLLAPKQTYRDGSQRR